MLRQTVALLVDLPQNVRATADEAVDSVTDFLQSIGRIEQHLRAIGGKLGTAGEDIHELRASSRRQEARVERVEGGLTELNGRLSTIETLVSGLARTVDDAAERIPDKDKGPLGKAREALTGNSGRRARG
jgi:DNA anti-recombination protein RmuC